MFEEISFENILLILLISKITLEICIKFQFYYNYNNFKNKNKKYGN